MIRLFRINHICYNWIWALIWWIICRHASSHWEVMARFSWSLECKACWIQLLRRRGIWLMQLTRIRLMRMMCFIISSRCFRISIKFSRILASFICVQIPISRRMVQRLWKLIATRSIMRRRRLNSWIWRRWWETVTYRMRISIVQMGVWVRLLMTIWFSLTTRDCQWILNLLDNGRRFPRFNVWISLMINQRTRKWIRGIITVRILLQFLRMCIRSPTIISSSWRVNIRWISSSCTISIHRDKRHRLHRRLRDPPTSNRLLMHSERIRISSVA